MPKITPTKIQTPTLSELALMLRAMGLDISGDHALLKHLRHVLSLPDLDVTTFNDVYATQANAGNDKGDDQFKDTNEKLFEQNDEVYT